MRKSGLQNARIEYLIAGLGHTQTIVVGDVGLPIPQGVEVVDLAVADGVPDFMTVLKAVAGELVYEKYFYAREMEDANRPLLEEMRLALGDVPFETVPHEQFKQMTRQAKAIIRTGSCKSYANVILVGSVNF